MSASCSLRAVPIVVRLDDDDMRLVEWVANARNEMNLRRGTRQRPGTPDDGRLWRNTIGAAGECAVAKAFDIPWDGNVGDYKAPDVGDIEVKATKSPVGRLWLFKDSRLKVPYVLCRVAGAEVSLVGWQSGTFIMNNGTWESRFGATARYLENRWLRDVRELLPYRDRLMGRIDPASGYSPTPPGDRRRNPARNDFAPT